MRNKDVDPKSVAGTKSSMSRLRLLDFDDLFVLSHLLEGSTIAATAKQLGLTQPAITQRVRKIERAFGEPMLQKAGRHVKLTQAGRAVCIKAADALALMQAVAHQPHGQMVTVGADPLTTAGWLWPAVRALREARPELTVHCYVAAAEELPALLETGGVDALLAAVTHGGSAYGALDIDGGEFVFVARPDVVARATSLEALADLVLLDIDRSYPLLSRLEPGARAAARFRDVWFVGATSHILSATLQGLGVAILPQALVRTLLAAGKLGLVLPELDLSPQSLRLVYRRDRAGDELVRALAERLALAAKAP